MVTVVQARRARIAVNMKHPFRGMLFYLAAFFVERKKYEETVKARAGSKPGHPQ